MEARRRRQHGNHPRPLHLPPPRDGSCQGWGQRRQGRAAARTTPRFGLSTAAPSPQRTDGGKAPGRDTPGGAPSCTPCAAPLPALCIAASAPGCGSAVIQQTSLGTRELRSWSGRGVVGSRAGPLPPRISRSRGEHRGSLRAGVKPGHGAGPSRAKIAALGPGGFWRWLRCRCLPPLTLPRSQDRQRAANGLLRAEQSHFHLNFCQEGSASRLVHGRERRNRARGCPRRAPASPGAVTLRGAAGATGPGCAANRAQKKKEHQLRLCSCSQIAAKRFEVQIKVFHQV